ncbi:hypothetical protein MANES_14G168266v8 [Manihot esculenta]|uniref:Uncharacterized protein n=1 Tax=Manihot esculenta TaxID=3983 RepID=A0ACB7GM18_MANES|nr:hypothetical protein MANES_14G168266v8 [Manihot esculenta]
MTCINWLQKEKVLQHFLHAVQHQAAAVTAASCMLQQLAASCCCEARISHFINFKCEWFDTNRGVRVHPQHGLVEINVKLRLASSDPFILAQQAHQVCYIKYPKINKVRVDWCAVFKTKARSTYNIGLSMVNINSNEQNSSDVAYQDDDVSRPKEIVPTTELDDPTMLLDSSIIVEVDVNELQNEKDEEEEEDTEESDDDLEVDGVDSDDDVNLEDDSE